MCNRRSQPMRRKFSVTGAGIFVIAGIFATPVVAATSARIDCPEAAKATLELPLGVLATAFVISETSLVSSVDAAALERIELASSSSILAPRAEAAIRKAFSASNAEPMAGTDSPSRPASESEQGVETDAAMNTRLPGVSDDNFSRYRKQMYRRDI